MDSQAIYNILNLWTVPPSVAGVAPARLNKLNSGDRSTELWKSDF